MHATYSRSRGRSLSGLVALLALTALSGCAPPETSKPSSEVPAPQRLPAMEFDVMGRTQCVPARKALIAPVPLHPVVEVLAVQGDVVKKGQPLVKLDDDEAQADVRLKQATLDNAQLSLKEARRQLISAEKAYHSGALPEQRYHEIRTAALKAEGEERLAVAALDSSKAELEHFVVTAQIDGIISSLNVNLGMVSRPGTTVWGEILDLSEIEVRAEVTPEQADGLVLGQTAELLSPAKKVLVGKGRLIFIGIAADAKTGLVPVVVRMKNPESRIRCGVPLQVRFKEH